MQVISFFLKIILKEQSTTFLINNIISVWHSGRLKINLLRNQTVTDTKIFTIEYL